MGRNCRTIAALALLGTSAAHAESFGNADIVALHRAGLSGDAIIAKVRSQPCGYDTSTNALIALRKADVPQAVIVAMINRCVAGGDPGPDGTDAPARHALGIFMASGPADNPREVMLRPSAASSLKITGNGSILFPRLAKLVVPQPHAQAVATSARPGFTFYFDPVNRRVGGFGQAASDAAQSPSEFSLVHFRADGSYRQVVIGRVEAYVAVTGVDPQYTLPFTINDLGDGTFRVDMQQDLAPGEYGFVLPGEAHGGRGGTAFRIYDFEVK